MQFFPILGYTLLALQPVPLPVTLHKTLVEIAVAVAKDSVDFRAIGS